MSKTLRIMVVNDAEGNAPGLRSALEKQGFSDVAIAGPDIHLPDRIAFFKPDVILINSESDARDILEHVVVATMHAPRPLVLSTLDTSQDLVRAAVQAGVSAYVAADLGSERLAPVLEVAVARFEAEQTLKAELNKTQKQLAERRWVDRAKAQLMNDEGLTEDQAYKRLRDMAMNKGLKIADVARTLLKS